MWRKSSLICIREPKGFSLAELMLVVAIIGILAVIVIPWWLTYAPAATLAGAARQVQSGLNQARMLAISTRQSTCVEIVPPSGYRYRQNPAGPNTCGGAVVTPDTGADGTGTFWAFTSNNIRLAGPSAIFTPFGNASQTAVLTITGPQARTITVTVQPSGRVQIP